MDAAVDDWNESKDDHREISHHGDVTVDTENDDTFVVDDKRIVGASFTPKCLTPDELAALFLSERTDGNIDNREKSKISPGSDEELEAKLDIPPVKILQHDFNEEEFMQKLAIGVPVKKYSRKGKVSNKFLHYDNIHRVVYWSDVNKRSFLKFTFLQFRHTQEPLPLESLNSILLSSYLPPYGMFCPVEDASRSVSMRFSSRSVDLTFRSEKEAGEIVSGFLELRRILVDSVNLVPMNKQTKMDKEIFTDFSVNPEFPTG